MIAAAENASRQQEDALYYLTRKDVIEYRRGQVIYDEYRPSQGLSHVIRGRVKVTLSTDDGTQALVGIFFADEFFGAAALLGVHTTHRQRAIAMENTTLMSWTPTDIEAEIERHPMLGVALIQILAGQCMDLGERLQSLALDKIPKRMAVSLLRFAKSGVREPDGAIVMPPLTQELLSENVGTSRELVSSQMNQLRRQGFVRYSRKSIQIYPEALTEQLRNHPA